MFNMISAELYKLRKSKSFWIMLVIAAGMAAFTSIVFGLLPAEDLMGMRPESASEMLIGAVPMNLATILYILVFVVVVFVNSDFDSGTIRNSLAVGVSRLEYYVAKFVMILITCAAFVIVTVLATGLPYLAFEPWGDMFNFGNFIASVGVGYLILVAQGTLFMAVALMVRKVGLTVGIVLGYLVLDMIVGGFMAMIELGDVLRALANIFPSPAGIYLMGLSLGTADFSNVLIVILVSVVMIAVMSLLAIKNLVKRDV